jgi:hypothetical protein
MQGQYTCDDGTVNGAAPTAGTEVLYSVNSRWETGIEGRTILAQRWEDTTLAGTNIISSIAGMFNCSFSGSLQLASFTYSTDDMGFMSCRFNSATPITLTGAGQTVRMDATTYTSFISSGSSWVTNTPTIAFLDMPNCFYTVSTSAQLDSALVALRAMGGGIVQIASDITYSPAANRNITNITIKGSSNGVSMTKLTMGNANYMYGNSFTVSQLGIDPNLTNPVFKILASTAFITIDKLQHRGIPTKNVFDFGGFSVYLWATEVISCNMNNTSGVTAYLANRSALTFRNGGTANIDASSSASGTVTVSYSETSNKITNGSTVSGITVSDALNTLNTNKANSSSATGTFLSQDGKTVTVTNGVIISIV